VAPTALARRTVTVMASVLIMSAPDMRRTNLPLLLIERLSAENATGSKSFMLAPLVYSSICAIDTLNTQQF